MIAVAAFLSAMTLASCSDKDDSSTSPQVAGNEIRINATVQNATGTRAVPVTISSLNKFGLFAKTKGGSDFMGSIGSPVIYTGSNGTFTTPNTYYWSSDTLDFFAYYPVADGVDVTWANNRYTGPYKTWNINYAIPTDISKQVDLMKATASNVKKNDNGGIVNLTFNHLLSQVKFAIAKPASNLEVTIQSITVCNAFPLYDISTIENSGNYAGQVVAPTYYSQKADFKITPSSTVKVNASTSGNISFQDKGGVLMLPPQYNPATCAKNGNGSQTTPGNYIIPNGKLRISCKIYDNVNKRYIVGTANSYGNINIPLEYNWLAGKCYTYILNFTGKDGFGYDDEGYPTAPKVGINVGVTDWQNQSSSSIEISK